jgi:hypothetical protein
VGKGRIGTLEDALARLELEAGDGRHGCQDRTSQRCDGIDSSERCRYLFGPCAERPCSQARLTRSAAPKAGHPPERSPRPCALPERETLAKPDSQPEGTRPATQ